jgi:hypothetical protein
MPYGNNLSPIDPTVEKVTVTFNFAPWFAAGVTVTSIASITALVAEDSLAQDPNPQNVVFGSPQIGNVPGLPANTAVLQQISGCVANVTYVLECLVGTSDNQELNLATQLACVPLNS